MNMSYIRFENTVPDLRDCYRHMEDDDLSESEKAARLELIKLCVRIAGDYEDELP